MEDGDLTLGPKFEVTQSMPTLKRFAAFFFPKDVWSIVVAGIVGYAAVMERPFVANDIAFQIAQISPMPSADKPSTVDGVTELVIRVVMLNRGNRQVSVYRLIPAIRDSKDAGLFHKLYYSDNWDERNPKLSIDSNKTEIVDLHVKLYAKYLEKWSSPPTSDAARKIGANQKVAAMLCIATMASNGEPRKFINQVAWMYFRDGNYLLTEAFADVLPVEDKDSAPDCIDSPA